MIIVRYQRYGKAYNYNTFAEIQQLSDYDRIVNINCSYNTLTSLPEHLPDALHILWCYYNELTSLPEHLPDGLLELDCSYNEFTSLPGHLPHTASLGNNSGLPDALQELYCYNNKLTSLPEHLPDALQTLWCNNNQLTLLPEHLPNTLQYLHCHTNKLTSLPEHLPDALQKLICSNNPLTSLPEHLPNALQQLECSDNQLTSLPEHLPDALEMLYFSGNPDLEYINTTNNFPNLRYVTLYDCPKLNPLIITQLERIIIRNKKQDNTNLYTDNQNVHDHQVQKSFIDSVNLLIKNYANIKLPDDLILPDSSNNLHSATNLTEKELLTLCVKAIYSLDGDAKEEAYKRLTEELTDGDCKCLTGKMTRMVNALTGFVDGISIGISENAQIQAIYQLCNGDFDKFKKELLERDFSQEVMKMWLEVEV